MARRIRLQISGLPLHIVQRGNDKGTCFGHDRDFRVFLNLLDELSGRYECAIHAYVLMTNHVHLLLTPRRGDGPSFLMKHIGQRFAQFVNRKYARTGGLFEGRFRSCIVDSDGYLLCCQRYIEMNPVRAGMVAHPSQYPWSSYGANALGIASDLVEPHPVYLALGHDDRQRRCRYAALFSEDSGERELSRIREAINTGSVLGRDVFIDRLPEWARAGAARFPPGRPSQGAIRPSVPPKRKRGLTPI